MIWGDGVALIFHFVLKKQRTKCSTLRSTDDEWMVKSITFFMDVIDGCSIYKKICMNVRNLVDFDWRIYLHNLRAQHV